MPVPFPARLLVVSSSEASRLIAGRPIELLTRRAFPKHAPAGAGGIANASNESAKHRSDLGDCETAPWSDQG